MRLDGANCMKIKTVWRLVLVGCVIAWLIIIVEMLNLYKRYFIYF